MMKPYTSSLEFVHFTDPAIENTYSGNIEGFTGNGMHGSKLKPQSHSIQEENAAEFWHQEYDGELAEEEKYDWWMFFGKSIDEINVSDDKIKARVKRKAETSDSYNPIQSPYSTDFNKCLKLRTVPSESFVLRELFRISLKFRPCLKPKRFQYNDFYDESMEVFRTFGPSERALNHILASYGHDMELLKRVGKHSIVHGCKNYIKREMIKASTEIKCMAERRQQLIRLNMIESQQPNNIFKVHGNTAKESPNMNNVKGMNYRKLAISNCMLEFIERESQQSQFNDIYDLIEDLDEDGLMSDPDFENFDNKDMGLTVFLNSDFDDLGVSSDVHVHIQEENDPLNDWINEIDEENLCW
ncbi:hypothetical protein CLIB1444_01S19306 [[Candida] jaroonii]|uniref:Uncharacterized protein n=1 Tax=[Candida] jaroonii TaxID=467808 RepID=A0ACA9Y278_9ASCO|nr:hypothetical protein CLIB1444_01S19306 [[Candida] jaroonii]